jgi:tRNA (guanine-N7-)-methyltransferase
MKNKLERYEFNKNSSFIIQDGKPLFSKTKGRWSIIFKNNNPIYLELGCGNGEYTISNSKNYPNYNFIGIDIKGSRLWKGAKYLEKNNVKNALFLRIQIENILDFFDENEVKEIIISFPDPRPKKRDVKKRLTNLKFLDLYHKIILNGGKLMLKTDDKDLFDYSIDQIKDSKFKQLNYSDNLYSSHEFDYIKGVKTKYEKKFLDQRKTIKFYECLK